MSTRIIFVPVHHSLQDSLLRAARDLDKLLELYENGELGEFGTLKHRAKAYLTASCALHDEMRQRFGQIVDEKNRDQAASVG